MTWKMLPGMWHMPRNPFIVPLLTESAFGGSGYDQGKQIVLGLGRELRLRLRLGLGLSLGLGLCDRRQTVYRLPRDLISLLDCRLWTVDCGTLIVTIARRNKVKWLKALTVAQMVA